MLPSLAPGGIRRTSGKNEFRFTRILAAVPGSLPRGRPPKVWHVVHVVLDSLLWVGIPLLKLDLVE